jgi:hypothetical protein
MMIQRTLAILGVCLVSQGCGPVTLATRTLVLEPIHYCLTGDSVLEIRRNYQLAEEAWDAFTKAEPDPTYSLDYASGFKDGFADYLYAGGTGEPPPLPPRDYWKIHYETAQGHQAMEDWFAGFRHGAAVAEQSGYRQWVTLPSSVPPPNARDRRPSWLAPENTVVPPSEPALPPPRKVAPPPPPDKDGPDGGHPAAATRPVPADEDDSGKSQATGADPVPLPR